MHAHRVCESCEEPAVPNWKYCKEHSVCIRRVMGGRCRDSPCQYCDPALAAAEAEDGPCIPTPTFEPANQEGGSDQEATLPYSDADCGAEQEPDNTLAYSDDGQCYKYKCRSHALEGINYCIDHACYKCGGERDDDSQCFCKEHACKACGKERYSSSEFCLAHACIRCGQASDDRRCHSCDPTPPLSSNELRVERIERTWPLAHYRSDPGYDGDAEPEPSATAVQNNVHSTCFAFGCRNNRAREANLYCTAHTCNRCYGFASSEMPCNCDNPFAPRQVVDLTQEGDSDDERLVIDLTGPVPAPLDKGVLTC